MAQRSLSSVSWHLLNVTDSYAFEY